VSESAAHATLVRLLTNWVADSFLDGDRGGILVDTSFRPPQRKPPIVYGFSPDVYLTTCTRYQIVIGEAKTAQDVECMHTINQVEAFLRKCAEYQTSLFVFAVPWHRVGLALSILNYCRRRTGSEKVDTLVLEKLPG